IAPTVRPGDNPSKSREALSLRKSRLPIAAGIMFTCFGVIAILAVQSGFGLSVRSPSTERLAGEGPLAALGRLLGISGLSHGTLTALYFSLIVILFAAYLWAIILAWKKGEKVSRPLVYGFFIAFSLWLLFLPPLLSQDTFSYIFYGKALAVHGKNPLVTVPASYPGDPVVQYIGWKHTVSVYGPLSNYISSLLVIVSGKSVASNVIAFKLLNFAFLLGSLFLLDDLAGRLLGERGRLALLITAWNPLIIIHFSGSVHHDTIMIFLILLGLLLYRKDYPVLAISFIVLAATVKAIALVVLVPVLVLFLRENARRTLCQYLAAIAVLAAVPLAMYLPLSSGVTRNVNQVLRMGEQFSLSSIPSTVGTVIKESVRLVGGPANSTAGHWAVRVLFLLFFLVAFLVLCGRVRDYRSLIFACGAIALLNTLAAPYLMPWYIGLALFLVVLSGDSLWIGATLGATFSLSCYVRTINGQTGVVASVILLVTAIFLLIGVLRNWGGAHATFADSYSMGMRSMG
ncbi:MAG: polyprenol phosphomannose-dependent alpha 1,6 mannosyltransferase MptB, partial [Actinobacteria bacterium]|nr:polyprenol phosphomannose-dependent alpha 1,6 mannosyltransferase MptB [Actinomycetota bacterium]